jgi:SPP1 family predicted phage head-tail adaptor
MIAAGKLRHYVDLHTVSEVQDGYGEPVQTWAKDSSIHAAIEPLQGRELEHAQQVVAETTHRITVRYNSNVTVKTRFVWSSRTFEVVGIVDPNELHEQMICMCKEIS